MSRLDPLGDRGYRRPCSRVAGMGAGGAASGLGLVAHAEESSAMQSINRYEQLLRMCHLIEMLADARRPLSVSELKDGLVERGSGSDLADRTVRRDLGFLESFGYPLRHDPPSRGREGRWSLEGMPARGGLTPPPLSLPEVLALLVARDYLAPLAGTFYWRGITELLSRAERQAPRSLVEFAKEHRDGLVVHPRPIRNRYRSKVLSAINRSIRDSLELDILYRGVGKKQARRRRIQPESMVVYGASIYVAAYPGGSGPSSSAGLRFFKVDRLLAARVTPERFERREVGVADLLADSITLFRPSAEQPRRYRIVVAPERSRWACEKPFHPRQRVVHRPDGSVLLEIDRAWDGEMLPQLLGLAEYGEVLEPTDVRAALAASARRIVDMYAVAPCAKQRPAPEPESGMSDVPSGRDGSLAESEHEHLVSRAIVAVVQDR